MTKKLREVDLCCGTVADNKKLIQEWDLMIDLLIAVHAQLLDNGTVHKDDIIHNRIRVFLAEQGGGK